MLRLINSHRRFSVIMSSISRFVVWRAIPQSVPRPTIRQVIIPFFSINIISDLSPIHDVILKLYAFLDLLQRILRWPVDSLYKGPVMQNFAVLIPGSLIRLLNNHLVISDAIPPMWCHCKAHWRFNAVIEILKRISFYRDSIPAHSLKKRKCWIKPNIFAYHFRILAHNLPYLMQIHATLDWVM